MINVLIPMAGAGSRFSKAGYEKPKPFIDVAGKPMIARVMENLALPDAHYILVMQKSHYDFERSLVESLEKEYNVSVVFADGLTEGTACTVLLAQKLINTDVPLVVANSDQVVDFSFSDFVGVAERGRMDGSILVFRDETMNPKWSFARISEDGKVKQVAEKNPISDLATVGIYLFGTGSSFVESAKEMIEKNERVNNEFYTCPVYNYLIEKGLNIGVYEVSENAMHGLGTPEDLERYLAMV